jgi:hypothetical protein
MKHAVQKGLFENSPAQQSRRAPPAMFSGELARRAAWRRITASKLAG